MLEKEEVINKLKAEGINDTLGANLSFETTDELDVWVTNYKSALPKEKKLQDYTLEELEEISKDPQFKGAKGLQGLLDKVRQKATVKKTEQEPPKVDDKYDLLLQKFDEFKTSIEEKDKKNSQTAVLKMVKAKFSDEDEIDAVMSKIGADYSDTNVTKQIDWYVNKFNSSPKPLHQQGGSGNITSLTKKWKEGKK